MRIAKEIAGFTPAEAETLRKAIGKKIHSLMASLKEKFLEGAAQTGTTPAVANQLWKDMEQSQDYSFNKAHAACYALIAYRTAWLKANHPCEYMAALISSVMNTKDKVPLLRQRVRRARARGAAAGRQLVAGRLRGRRGEDPVRPERRQGRGGERRGRDRARARARTGRTSRSGTSPSGSTRRSSNKRVLEALVKCGALDSTGDPRRGHARRPRPGRAAGARSSRPTGSRARARSSTSGRREDERRRATTRPSRPASSKRRSCSRSRRSRSASTSPSTRSRPCATSSGGARTACSATSPRRRDGEVVTVGGIVGALKPLTTKKGEPMVFLHARRRRRLGARSSSSTPSTRPRASSARSTAILVIKGRVDHKQAGETKLLAMEVASFEATPERKIVTLKVDPRPRRRRHRPPAARPDRPLSGAARRSSSS